MPFSHDTYSYAAGQGYRLRHRPLFRFQGTQNHSEQLHLVYTAPVQMKTHYDAVVIGGGHNGLVAAAYLARAGQSVLLLERNSELGGATASDRIFPGMDAQISRYSYLVSLLPSKIVDDLGLQFTTRRRSIASCTPYDRDGESRVLLLSNIDGNGSRESFQALASDSDWRGYCELVDMERAFASRVWPSLLQPLRPRKDWEKCMTSPLQQAAWEAFVLRPLGEILEQQVEDDLIRGLLFTDAKIGIFTHPHDETLQQNRCFVLHIVGNGTGEWSVPVGGMRALVNALVASAQGAGAEVVTRAPVDRIHLGSPRHTVTFTRDERECAVEATRVLVNAGPQVLDEILGRKHVDAAVDEGSVCKVNMLLRRLPRPKGAGIDPRDAFGGTFHMDESYEQMKRSYLQASAGELPDKPPAEMYCHTLTDDSILGPELRAAGYQTLTLFGLDAPYRLFQTDHTVRKAEILRRYMDGLNQTLEEPIEDCLAIGAHGDPCIEIKTPQDFESELTLNRGNIFHAGLSWFFADDPEEAGFWGVETADERIYNCGASALRGGGVSGIPGHNAAQCIFEELGILGNTESRV